MKNFISLLLFCGCIVFVAGCKKLDEEGRKNVSGEVTLDGTPLKEGSIQFSPLETQAPSNAGVIGGTATIKNGKFELKRDLGLFAGTYTVRITHSVIIDLKTGSPAENPADYYDNPSFYRVESTVPEKYNTNTELTLTVGDDKNQTHDFALTK